MKRVLFAVLLLSALAVAQTHKIPATDTNNIWTGTNKFNAGLTAGDTATAANGTISLTNASGTTTVTLDGITGIASRIIGGIRYADQFAGADAGEKIAAAIADLPAGGGVVDARGFGATTQTISAAVTVGTSSKPVTLILNPATTFIPSAASTDMFSIGANGWVDGLTANPGAVSSYTGNCVKFPDTNTDGQRARLTNFLLTNGTVTSGVTSGTAVLLKATSGSNYIAFANLEHGRIVGFANGIYILSEGVHGGVNFVNDNKFHDLEVKNAVTAYKLQSNNGDVIGNVFTSCTAQYGPQSATAISMSANASANFYGNQFLNVAIWDYPNTAASYNLSANTRGNLIQGQAFSNTGAVNVDGGVANQIVDFEGGSVKPLPTWDIPATSVWTFRSGSAAIGTLFTTGLTFSGDPLFSGKGTFNGGVQPSSASSTLAFFKTATHATLDLASVASAACTAAQTETITGAALGDRCSVASGIGTADSSFYTCNVTATDTAKWSYCNLSGAPIDRASDTYTIQVVR